MKLVIALYKYFPWGGLQKDTLRFALEAAQRGHLVTIFTTDWQGDPPDVSITVHKVPVRACANHRAMNEFANDFLDFRYQHNFDVALAMNRIPGADFYFVADSCMASWMPQKHHKLVLKTFPRYRYYLRHEQAICATLATTRLMYIALTQKSDFMNAYQLPDERFIFLPPGMDPRCLRPDDADARRKQTRQKLNLDDDTIMLIEVGTNLWRKGADRVAAAMAALPEPLRKRTRFFIAGNDAPDKVHKVTQAHGVTDKVCFLGPRNDVPDLLLAADLMVHPAREEGTGTVLIEALAAGLPVLCTAACGFSTYVQDATHTVIAEPFSQPALNTLLQDALGKLTTLSNHTRTYAQTQDFCARNRVAIDAMEELAIIKQRLDLASLFKPHTNTIAINTRKFSHADSGCATHRDDQGTWTFLANFPLNQLNDILNQHRRHCLDKRCIKNDGKRRVTRVSLGQQSFIVKEFCKDYTWDFFNHGRRTWEFSQRLRNFSAPCLGWFRDRQQRSFLIFVDLGKMNLYSPKHLQHHGLPDLYAAAGKLLADLHGFGVYHADGKTTNYVINDLCPWLERPVALIDCDDVRFYRTLPSALRVKNLAQFLATTGNIPADRRAELIKPFLDGYRSAANFSTAAMATLTQQACAMISSGKITETTCAAPLDF
ncbi:MAG: glycosyltransferase family 4 protein [Lentisphaerae bacterium]|nr:glycosyltransferase family 4 protein [Lentisphaerota bacterium]